MSVFDLPMGRILNGEPDSALHPNLPVQKRHIMKKDIKILTELL